MSLVLVLDQQRKPLDPVHPGRARFLLSAGHAAVYRRYPFVIILKDAKPDTQPTPLRVKIDPGSQTTGIAVVNDTSGEVAWAAEVTHRGHQVKEHLDDRRTHRRSRRSRHTRYRPARYDNRARPKGWLSPSLISRIQNVVTWVERLRRYAPIGAISYELVRFDTQLIEHPDISGIEYQWGTLAGCEAREYLLLKWNYQCAYCGKSATRWEVDHRQIPKTHWLDAVCVGTSTPDHLRWEQVHPLLIRATGWQCRQMQNMDEYGFPTGSPKAATRVMGFRTGDMIRAVVPPGLVTSGTHVGRVSVRATGRFDIRTARERIKGVGASYCTPIHRSDGYAYVQGKEAALPPLA